MLEQCPSCDGSVAVVANGPWGVGGVFTRYECADCSKLFDEVEKTFYDEPDVFEVDEARGCSNG
jgi:transposase-like protein